MSFKKLFVSAVAVVVFSVSTIFSQVNVLSNEINFRNYDNAARTTYHYGDLILSGGSQGSGWGWMTTNQISCQGPLWVTDVGNFNGDLYTWGNLEVYGTKNFVQPHPTDTTKVIKYVAVEAGEALTLARGTAKTLNGTAIINLPEHFSLVTSADAPLTVLITPKRVPVMLYVEKESTEMIVVTAKKSDYYEFGDVEFSYQVTGVRDCFEDFVPIQDIDAQKEDGENSAYVSEKKKQYRAKVEKIMEKLNKNSVDKKKGKKK